MLIPRLPRAIPPSPTRTPPSSCAFPATAPRSILTVIRVRRATNINMGAAMSFRLVYQYGEQRRNMTESFETEAEAVAKACELITQGDARYLNIENEHGFVILSEAQI